MRAPRSTSVSGVMPHGAGLGHVFADSGMPATLSAPTVHRDTLVVVEYLDHAMGQADIDLATDQSVGHGVKPVQHLDVNVAMHLGALPLGIFEGMVGQGAQCGAFDLLIKSRRD